MHYEIAKAAASTVLFKSLLGVRSGCAPKIQTKALIVTDKRPCKVALELAQAYCDLMAESSSSIIGSKIDFGAQTFKDDVERFFTGSEEQNKVVILVENGAFQNELHQYRLRLELFRHGIRVAEHCHLKTMEEESTNYFNACCLDPYAAQKEGMELRNALAGAVLPYDDILRLMGKEELISPGTPQPSIVAYDLVVTSGAQNEHSLTFEAGLEPCLLNTGLYPSASAEASQFTESFGTSPPRQLSVGGTFPVGEVITESIDLGGVGGSAEVFAFPTTERRMCIIQREDPLQKLLRVDVEAGTIASLRDASEEGVWGKEKDQLQSVLNLIQSVEGDVWIRELGIGLNPHLGMKAPLSDVTSFERQRGIHVSLGKRHPLFPKKLRVDNELIPDSAHPRPVQQIGPVLRRKDGVFHIDLFVAANQLLLKPKAAFRNVLCEKVLMDFRVNKE